MVPETTNYAGGECRRCCVGWMYSAHTSVAVANTDDDDEQRVVTLDDDGSLMGGDNNGFVWWLCRE